MNSLGQNLSELEVNEMIKEADSNCMLFYSVIILLFTFQREH